MKKRLLLTVISAALLCAAAAGMFLLGWTLAPGSPEDAPIPETFLASVEEVQGSTLTVRGMEISGSKFQGLFTIDLDNITRNAYFSFGSSGRCSTIFGAELTYYGREISPQSLSPGDIVGVTFSGRIRGSDPGRLMLVLEVMLLEDTEK